MKPLFTTLLTFAFYLSIGQTSSIENLIIPGPEWYQGSILLNNGNELKGLVKYNDKMEVLSFENGRHSKSFTSRNVAGFEFFDEVEHRQRVYYAVPFEDRRNNIERPLFFEVILDLKDFALISKIDPIKFEKREFSTPQIYNPATGTFSAGRYYGRQTNISQIETLFIMTPNGDVYPYLKITEKEIDATIFDRSKTQNRILDEDALRKFTSPYYNELLTYAKNNSLSFKEKDDVIKILQHYAKLRQSL